MKNSILFVAVLMCVFFLHAVAQARDLSLDQIPVMFSFLDANQDGYLEYKEVKRVDSTLTEKEFLSIDKDGDERVTLDEYIAHLKKGR